jgi:hypothetical protein
MGYLENKNILDGVIINFPDRYYRNYHYPNLSVYQNGKLIYHLEFFQTESGDLGSYVKYHQICPKNPKQYNSYCWYDRKKRHIWEGNLQPYIERIATTIKMNRGLTFTKNLEYGEITCYGEIHNTFEIPDDGTALKLELPLKYPKNIQEMITEMLTGVYITTEFKNIIIDWFGRFNISLSL